MFIDRHDQLHRFQRNLHVFASSHAAMGSPQVAVSPVEAATLLSYPLVSPIHPPPAAAWPPLLLMFPLGMTSINDFNATYMCQGLPFGGVKDSGFGRFAGVEGLRALCHPKVGWVVGVVGGGGERCIRFK
jgi:hypothetical protein